MNAGTSASTGRGTRASVAVVGGILALLATAQGAAVAVGAVSEETVSVDLDLAAAPRAIQLETDQAGIVVTRGDVERPRISYTKRWMLTEPQLHQRLDGDTLVVDYSRATSDRGLAVLLGASPGSLTVTLPRKETTTPSLTVTSGTGGVDVRMDVTDLNVKTFTGGVSFAGKAANAALSTSTGGVELRAASVTGRLSAQTRTGSIDAELVGPQPAEIVLGTHTGGIRGLLPSGRYAVQAVTKTGSIYDELSRDAESPHRVNASALTGSIELRQR